VRPTFVIIGAQKAGSTFVQRALQDHPQVFLPPGERRFFEDPFFSNGGLADLDSTFQAAGAFAARGFKCADYLSEELVPKRLAQHLPEAQLFAVLRHPVRRAVSAYYHFIKRGALPVVHHEEGLRHILDGTWANRYPMVDSILPYGLYGLHLSRYFEHFEPSRLRVLLFEDLMRDKSATMEEIYRDLNVDDQFQSTNLSRRSQAVNYSLPRLRLLQFRKPLCFRWASGRSDAEVPLGAMSTAVWYATEAIDRYALAKWFGNPPPQLSEELHTQLISYYEEDRRLLERLLERDLQEWFLDAGRVASVT